MNLFNVREILDMGVEKEIKRRDFYKLASEKFEEAELKELFTKLKNWEDEHIKKFTEIRKNIKEVEATDFYPEELRDYARELVDSELYNDITPENFSDKVKTAKDALNYSIGFEKDAVLFFNELLRFVLSGKDVIENVIEEEKKHIVYLSEMKKKIN